MRMKIDGRCHCGAISYEADINPDNVIICHCTDCQTFSNAPYRVAVPVRRELFKLRGEPKRYAKRGDSGQEAFQNFCGVCGVTIFTCKEEGPAVSLKIGSVRQRAELPPKRQGYCRSAVPWAFDLSDVERLPDPERSL